MDVMMPEQRRKAMAHNRGRTKPELALARALWSRGRRYLTGRGYRRFHEALPGAPDIVFVRARLAIFVDGCFWHGCSRCGKVRPELMSARWVRKIQDNRARDAKVTLALVYLGWTVVRVPEHCLARKSDLATIAGVLSEAVASGKVGVLGHDMGALLGSTELRTYLPKGGSDAVRDGD